MIIADAWRSAFVCFLCALLAGCSLSGARVQDEEKDADFQAGKSRLRSMDYTGAMEAFQKAIETNPRSAAAHLELGLIRSQNVTGDWARAIYHLERYLELKPKASNAELIRQQITLCKRELAREVPLANVNAQVQHELEKSARIARENEELRHQIEQLMAQAGRHDPSRQDAGAPAGLPPGPARDARPPTGVQAPPGFVARVLPASPPPDIRSPARRTHLVKSGETLYSIAHQYGLKWPDLQKANAGVRPQDLRPGRVLVVPPP
jgi:LysM repeat protein